MHMRLVYLVLCALTVTVSAQFDHFGGGGSEIRCECTPSCSTVGVSECNGRILPRSDCPCCNVCLRLKGESCEQFNSPCEKGLACGPAGICEAEKSCKRDVECPDDKFCIRNLCADPCPLLQPCLQSSLKGGVCVTRKHVAQCDCPKQHKVDRDLNICVSLQEKSTDENVFETNEDTPLDAVIKSKKKSLLLQNTDHNSTIVILQTTFGGVLHYKESKPGSEFSRLTAKSGQTDLSLQGLRPLTRYTLKWAGNDGSEDKIEISTKDGCLHDLVSYGVGSKWNEECTLKCECQPEGKAMCLPRCIFVKGSIQDDQCTEITSKSDPECCVEYACKNSSSPKVKEIPKSSKTLLGRIEAKLIVTSKTHDSITVAWENFREINSDEGYVAEYRKAMHEETEKWMQQVVSQGPLPPNMTIEKLQPNTIYQVRVGLFKNNEENVKVATTETITVRTQKFDPCMKRKCGQNAHCEISLTSDELGNCTCNIGFYLDVESSLCQLDKNYTSDKTGCSFQSKEYSPGDIFYDGCQYKCICDEHREIDCQPRCLFNADSTVNDDCLSFTDPEDKCCKLMVCNTTLKSPYNALQSSSLDFDGCLYSNKTYKKNENFTIGCELKCLCMGYGDVSCFPRCPPVKNMSIRKGVKCATLDDPLDSCCSVTICDNSTSEVMKDKELMVDEEIIMAGAEKIDNGTKQNMNSSLVSSINAKTNDTATIGHNVSSSTEKLNISSIEDNTTSSSTGITNFSMPGNTTVKEHITMTSKAPTFTENKTNLSSIATKEETGASNETSTVSTESSTEKVNMAKVLKTENNTTVVLNTSLTTPVTEISNNTVVPVTPDKNITSQSTARSSPSLILSNVNLTTSAKSSNISNVTNKSIHERKLRFEDNNLHVAHLDILDVHKRDAETIQIKVKVSQDIMAELLSFTRDPIIVSYSHDSTIWKNQSVLIGGIEILSVNTISFSVDILNGDVPYMLRIYYKHTSSPIKISKTPGSHDLLLTPKTDFLTSTDVCQYKGKSYKIGEAYYDGCENYCTCTEKAEVLCAKIECPDHFGLDLMDPGCLEWKDDKSYVPVPPRCCRRKPRCILRIEDLACTIDNHTFDHLDVLPLKFVKCDQRCQCMKGHIDCENLCSPIQAIPPFDLPCHPTEATVVKHDGYPCCPEWKCSNASVNVYPPLRPGIPLPGPPSRPSQPTHRIFLPIILDIGSNSVQFSFKIPRQFVGLPGGIYLRYTPSASTQTNPLDWQSEVIHEDGLTLSGADWVYQKNNLHPDANYSMQVVLSSHLAKTEIVSPIFSVKTLGIATSPLPRLELNAALKISEVKNISAKVSWRQFTDYELQYIDGIGVRYWPDGKKFPLEGPMLHRKADNYMLKDLWPDTGYTVDLIFLTHDGYSTNIFNTHNITFKTLSKPKDKYAFNISIKMGNVTEKGVQIVYSGVTEPEGKYVNVFRVVYTTDGDLKDSQKFKVPKNQKEGFILLTDLKPGVDYGVWLEAYLTNGLRKKSNVITIHTNPAELTKPGSITVDGAAQIESAHNYLTAFVLVSILAALACIAFILLIIYVWRRQNHAKAHISSKVSYDNPSYKGTGVSYGIEMNGMKSNGNSRDDS